MGTGSFGGGSGSFGGGGSGAPLGGRRSGDGTSRSGRGRRDSVFDRIFGLITLTRDVNEHPEKKKARAAVIAALETPPRLKYLRQILGDPFVEGVYRGLFALRELVVNGFEWPRVAREYDLDPERASLSSLSAALVDRRWSPAVDERIVEIANSAVRDLLLKAVGDDLALYSQAQRSRELARSFEPKVLDNTADRFIAAILCEVVRRDVLELSDEARAMLGEVFLEIGKRWCDIFAETSREFPKTRYRGLLAAIARDPSSFPVNA